MRASRPLESTARTLGAPVRASTRRMVGPAERSRAATAGGPVAGRARSVAIGMTGMSADSRRAVTVGAPVRASTRRMVGPAERSRAATAGGPVAGRARSVAIGMTGMSADSRRAVTVGAPVRGAARRLATTTAIEVRVAATAGAPVAGAARSSVAVADGARSERLPMTRLIVSPTATAFAAARTASSSSRTCMKWMPALKKRVLNGTSWMVASSNAR